MLSPCIKICKLDPKQQFCLGCKRTVEEIAKWSSFTEQQQIIIIEQLKGR
jgi:predicted Fe-S protein YdhL (DUF1289 family)